MRYIPILFQVGDVPIHFIAQLNAFYPVRCKVAANGCHINPDYIAFPDRDTLKKIVDVHYPGISNELVAEALDVFFDVRKVPGLKKKPSTSELVDWLKLLMADNIGEAVLRERDPTKAIPPLAGALVKNEQDVQLLERLAFMARRAGR